MLDLFSKLVFNQIDIERIVAISAEESLYLEFKSSGSISQQDSIKSEISKDISAFANSDGGIIIYGIVEEKYKASSLSPIDGNVFTKEWLEQVISSRIQRRIPEYQIFPIRIDNHIEKTIYLVKVNRSNSGPHMASDGRYYKRSNVQVIKMEEYEVRDHYFRINATNLEIEDFEYKKIGARRNGDSYSSIQFEISFQIKNTGNTVEKDYKLEIVMPELPYLQGQNLKREYFIRSEGLFMVFSVPNKSPIFQDELTTVWNVTLSIEKKDFGNLNYHGIRTTLYYTGGIKIKTFYPLEKLSYADTLIEKLTWV
jgi:hypothetical protein